MRILIVCLMLLSLMTLSGCRGDPYGCDSADEPHHCLQNKALEEGDPSACDHISKDKAKQLGVKSNPPKDKCYLMVAKENSDYSLCDKIKGGEMSYSKSDCIFEIIAKEGDIQGCDRLEGTDRFEECNQTFRSSNTLAMKDHEINALEQKLKNDPENPELQKELEKAMKQKQEVFDVLSPSEQTQYLQTQREEIMKNVEDTEVKSAISKDFVEFKKNNPDATINETLEAIQNATKKQSTLKRLDEETNKLVDEVKQQMMEYAQHETPQEIEAKSSQWLSENGGKDIQRSLQKLERLKKEYSPDSEDYQILEEKYQNMKDVYDGIQEVYNKMDEFDTLASQGKITEEKAKVLKGAILLQNGLTSVSEYVPVFGSTISEITDETFNTTMEFAKKRAQRATALDKCIEDPLNCDTDGISGY